MQPYALLSAFIYAGNHFLSNDRIIEICGWNPKGSGIDSRRRTTISQLRKLIDSKNTHVQIVSGTDENKNNGFYLIVEKYKMLVVSGVRGVRNFLLPFLLRKLAFESSVYLYLQCINHLTKNITTEMKTIWRKE